MLRRLSALLLLLFLPLLTEGAGDAPLDRATLLGLKGVNVVIDRLDPVLQDYGLTQESLRARIVERLQKAGVTVDKDAAEFLGLRILQVRARRGPYNLCIAVGLYQPVVLSRDKNIRTATPTWEVETILIAQRKSLLDASLSSVDLLTDRFLTAYQSVNPH